MIRYDQFHSHNFIAFINYNTVVHMNSYLTYQTGMIRYDQFYCRNFIAFINYNTVVELSDMSNKYDQV